MFKQMVNLGIDLGTTNSVASVFVNGDVEEIEVDGSPTMPSAVYPVVNKQGETSLTVGAPAKSQLSNPKKSADVLTEFKRRMGEGSKLESPTSRMSFAPEELSAEVLKKLRGAVQSRFQEQPDAAVITIPAMFEQAQRDATARAAELAGFKQSILLQEPVAAAICHGLTSETAEGYWLVFDYGGGTFDASLVSVRDGELVVVKHAGDNYLGGADFDRVLVDKVLLPALFEEFEVDESDYDRKLANAVESLEEGPKRTKAINARAKLATLGECAQQLKKKLSTESEPMILVERIGEDNEGEDIELEVSLSRGRFNELIHDLVERAITITKDLIEQSGVSAGQIDKLLPIGGSTYVPYVRERLSELGISVDYSTNPMTAVSKGAAAFAANQRVVAEIAEKRVVATGVVKATLDYEPTVADDEFDMGGTLELEGEVLKEGWSVEFKSGDFVSPKCPLNAQGLFFIDLSLFGKDQAEFQISVFDPDGNAFECDPSSVVVTKGLSVGKQNLPSALGIGLYDDSVAFFATEGTPYPYTSERQIRTLSFDLEAGSDDELRVPILSGGSDDVESNKTSGYFVLRGTDLQRDLPEGTEIEIVLSLEQDGRSTFSFTVPLIDQTFEVKSNSENASVLEYEPAEVMREKLGRYRRDLDGLLERAENSADASIASELRDYINGPTFTETEIQIASWASGDPVAGPQAERALIEVRKKCKYFEGLIIWPELVTEFEEQRDSAAEVVEAHGSDMDKARWSTFCAQADKVVKTKDPDRLKQITLECVGWWHQMQQQDPEYHMARVAILHENYKHLMTDQGLAAVLFQEAMLAYRLGDVDKLKSCVGQLQGLLPANAAVPDPSGAPGKGLR